MNQIAEYSVNAAGDTFDYEPYDMFCPLIGGDPTRNNMYRSSCETKQKDPSQTNCFEGCYLTRGKKDKDGKVKPKYNKRATPERMIKQGKIWAKLNDQGMSHKRLALANGVSKSTVQKFIKIYREYKKFKEAK